MKIYLDYKNSKAIERIISNLVIYLPENVNIVHEKNDADLIILHVFGRNNHITAEAREILAGGHEYAVIQYSLYSTRNPDPSDWKFLWNNAKFVYSYYDLREHIKNFYHAPLGVDPKIFYPDLTDKPYLIGTLGAPVEKYYKVECFGEIWYSTYMMGARGCHVGDDFTKNPVLDYYSEPDDETLKAIYNKCRWFSGLRRKDGFNLCGLEALCCGVRPIYFDTPIYRQWFDGIVEFIPEDSPQQTIINLLNIFKKKKPSVSRDEIDYVINKFSWSRFAEGFWERCMI